jgi:hypothetical protein
MNTDRGAPHDRSGLVIYRDYMAAAARSDAHPKDPCSFVFICGSEMLAPGRAPADPAGLPISGGSSHFGDFAT